MAVISTAPWLLSWFLTLFDMIYFSPAIIGSLKHDVIAQCQIWNKFPLWNRECIHTYIIWNVVSWILDFDEKPFGVRILEDKLDLDFWWIWPWILDMYTRVSDRWILDIVGFCHSATIHLLFLICSIVTGLYDWKNVKNGNLKCFRILYRKSYETVQRWKWWVGNSYTGAERGRICTDIVRGRYAHRAHIFLISGEFSNNHTYEIRN